MTRPRSALTAASILLLACTAGHGVAATRHVDLASTNPVAPYVSWSTAATAIQDAVDVCSAGDTVLVSNGVYETGGRALLSLGGITNRVAVTNAVTLASVNGPAVTFIRGEQGANNPDNYPFGNASVRCVYLGTGAVLSGFSLVGGSTPISSSSYDGAGGGAYCATGALVTGCRVLGNTAWTYGGAVFGGTVVDSLLETNSAGFGGGCYGSVLSNCVLRANVGGEGGGADVCFLEACTIESNSANYGGGSYKSVQRRSILRGNWGFQSGGGAMGAMTFGIGSESKLHECLLIGNRAAQGGGAMESEVYSCTIYNNQATYEGGGVFGSVVANSIVYANTASNVVVGNQRYSLLTYSCTFPLPPLGTNIITGAPRFVDAAGGDFRLLANSPCIDAGTTNGQPVSGLDLAAGPRVVGSGLDMGAYEYDPSAAGYDTDADGQTDRDEYFAGTQATNNTSFFAPSAQAAAEQGTVTFSIGASSTGRVYGAYQTPDLRAAPQLWIPLGPEVPGTGGALSVVVTNDAPSRMLRFGVRLP